MPANADLTVSGRSSTTSSALPLASVLVDDRAGVLGNSRTLGIELLQRGSDGAIYVSNCSIAPATGMGPQLCPTGGQVVRIG